jgi:multidrug efflux pump
MAVVMLAILMIQLQSFSRLALVFVTAPLGIVGATAALLIANSPFGFVALLGMIALAGMIMRNTVILVDQIDHDIAAGHGRHRAVIDATVRRARPVVLTALAAILGMIPLARSLFWGPMAITIMGGLFVATVLTLLVVPALYALWFRVREDEPEREAAVDEDQPRRNSLRPDRRVGDASGFGRSRRVGADAAVGRALPARDPVRRTRVGVSVGRQRR